MRKHGLRGRTAAGLALVAALLLVACGEQGAGDAATPADAASATPFAVDRVPPGYELVAAGEGERPQEWGNDSAGTDEPFLVLANGDQRVFLHTFGYEGLQGGFDQGAGKGLEADGWLTEARDLGDDMGIKATSADIDRTVLVDLLGRAEAPEDRMNAPTVDDLPAGWSVVGHTDAQLLLSITGAGGPPIAVGPGPPGSLGAGWTLPDGRGPGMDPSLAVVRLPGDAAELAAWHGRVPRPVLWYGDAVGTPVRVSGRDGVFISIGEGEGGTMHVVLTRMEDGSLLVVTSSAYGSEPLPEAALLDVAASVRPADSDEWAALLDSAWGGPELRPDEGAVELARGVEQGQEWLLQATPTPLRDPNVRPDPNVQWYVDTCLKLLGGRRACTDGSSTAGVSSFTAGGSPANSSGFAHSFHLVVTRLPGTSVAVTTSQGRTTAPLIPLPDSSARVAVVFGDVGEGWSVPGCSALELPELDDVELFTVDILDDAGDFLGCTPSIVTPPDSPELRVG